MCVWCTRRKWNVGASKDTVSNCRRMLQVSAKMLKYPEQNGYLQPPVRVWINNTLSFLSLAFFAHSKKKSGPRDRGLFHVQISQSHGGDFFSKKTDQIRFCA